MPIISQFYGIVIKMYYGDHQPPHFHAEYGEHKAMIQIAPATILAGSLPRRQWRLVWVWAAQHQKALSSNWDLAFHGNEPEHINGLE